MSISENLSDIQNIINQRCADADRSPESAHLIAVSKTKPQEDVVLAIEAGQKTFGENRVQEAEGKFPDLKAKHVDLEVHLIGPLQTNKAKDAVALFDVIHTVDREKLIKSLASAMESVGRNPKCLIQVNTGAEPQKAGVSPEDLSALLKAAKDAGLPIYGLMCIPPADQLPAPHFAFLKKLAYDHKVIGPNESEPWISMGMSGDYADAVELGATHVRVGSAIFGGRPTQ